MFCRRLGHVEKREDVSAEGSFELVLRNVLDVFLRVLLASIVDQNVKMAKLLDSIFDGRLAKRLVADIARD